MKMKDYICYTIVILIVIYYISWLFTAAISFTDLST